MAERPTSAGTRVEAFVHSHLTPEPVMLPRVDDTADIRTFLEVLNRRRFLITATVVLLTTLVALVAFTLKPRYTANALIMLETHERGILGLQNETERPLTTDLSIIETQIRILTSNDFVRRVMDKLNLVDDPEFNLAIRLQTGAASLLDRLSATLARWVSAARLLPGDPHLQQPDTAPAEKATETFKRQLQVSQFGHSYIVSIDFTSPNPEKAAQVANTTADLYIANALALKQEGVTHTADWLNGRIQQLREQLLQADQAVEAYRAQHQLVGVGSQPELGGQQLAALQSELIAVGAQRSSKEAELRLIENLGDSGESLESVAAVIASPMIANLRQEETRLLHEQVTLAKEFGPQHPRIIQIQTGMDNLTQRLRAEIQNIVQSTRNDLKTLKERQRLLQAQLDQVKQQSFANNQAAIRAGMLEREAESTRALYVTFLNRYKELSEQKNVLDAGALVISRAPVPAEPGFPRPNLMIAGGFTSALLIGVLLAFVAERLDRGLRSGRQVERVLGIPHLGIVPKIRHKRRESLHQYVQRRPYSMYTEAIRSVHSAVHFSNPGRPPQVIVVVSSLPGEGKTTTALSLATLLARSGHKTVLVDLDLRRPMVSEPCRQSSGGGVVEFVGGEATLDEVIHRDSTGRGPDVVPVRRTTLTPTDLLSSSRMAGLIEGLRSRYEYVILDTCPILGLSDARFVARIADAVLLLVRWGTDEELARRALRVLVGSGANVIGAAMTQVDIRRQKKYSFTEVAHYYGPSAKSYGN